MHFYSKQWYLKTSFCFRKFLLGIYVFSMAQNKCEKFASFNFSFKEFPEHRIPPSNHVRQISKELRFACERCGRGDNSSGCSSRAPKTAPGPPHRHHPLPSVDDNDGVCTCAWTDKKKYIRARARTARQHSISFLLPSPPRAHLGLTYTPTTPVEC